MALPIFIGSQFTFNIFGQQLTDFRPNILVGTDQLGITPHQLRAWPEHTSGNEIESR